MFHQKPPFLYVWLSGMALFKVTMFDYKSAVVNISDYGRGGLYVPIDLLNCMMPHQF